MKYCPKHPTRPLFNKNGCTWCAKAKFKPICKVSEKRKTQNNAYLKAQAEYLKVVNCCQANVKCKKGTKATEVHHKRGRWGWLLLATGYWLAVCRDCHDFITENSAEAIKLGLSEKRNTSIR